MSERTGFRLQDLVAAGVLATGTAVLARHAGKTYVGRITEEGEIEVQRGRRVIRGTPSGTAKAITGWEVNGWVFWKVEDPAGNSPLARFRDQVRP